MTLTSLAQFTYPDSLCMPFDMPKRSFAVTKPKVVIVALELRFELMGLPPDITVPVFLHKALYLAQEFVAAFAAGFSRNPVASFSLHPHIMRKSEKIEGSRVVRRPGFSVVWRRFPELDDSCFLL